MPTINDYEELIITAGMRIRSVEWGADVIRKDFGYGYGATALVGPATGLHKFRLQASILPDSTSLGTIGGLAWFDYYYDFFIARTTGSEPMFYVRWRSAYWHVRFASPEVSFDKFKGDLYAGGVELEQKRVVDFTTYAADGSIT